MGAALANHRQEGAPHTHPPPLGSISPASGGVARCTGRLNLPLQLRCLGLPFTLTLESANMKQNTHRPGNTALRTVSPLSVRGPTPLAHHHVVCFPAPTSHVTAAGVAPSPATAPSAPRTCTAARVKFHQYRPHLHEPAGKLPLSATGRVHVHAWKHAWKQVRAGWQLHIPTAACSACRHCSCAGRHLAPQQPDARRASPSTRRAA